MSSTTCKADGCESTNIGRRGVCTFHTHTDECYLNGERVRFCQRCKRFHSLDSFDGNYRTCRSVLKLRANKRKRGAVHDGENAASDETTVDQAHCLTATRATEKQQKRVIDLEKMPDTGAQQVLLLARGLRRSAEELESLMASLEEQEVKERSAAWWQGSSVLTIANLWIERVKAAAAPPKN